MDICLTICEIYIKTSADSFNSFGINLTILVEFLLSIFLKSFYSSYVETVGMWLSVRLSPIFIYFMGLIFSWLSNE